MGTRLHGQKKNARESYKLCRGTTTAARNALYVTSRMDVSSTRNCVGSLASSDQPTSSR